MSNISVNSTLKSLGLFGAIKAGTIKNLKVSSGTVQGNHSDGCFGGVVGEGTDGAQIINCANTGVTVKSTSIGVSVGGVVGNIDNATIIGCSNSGTVSGHKNVGGIVGGIWEKGNIYGCTNSGAISSIGNNAGLRLGGIAGGNGGNVANVIITIANCSNSGTLTETANADVVIGGIVGLMYGSVVAKCSNTGNVTGTKNAGGIAGEINPKGTIVDSYNTGNVSAQTSGGIAGYTNNSGLKSICNCYNQGSVTGTVAAGGIVGYFGGTTTTGSAMKNCYNSGTLTGTKGGIVQNNAGTNVIEYCYWLYASDLNAVGTGLSAASSCASFDSSGNVGSVTLHSNLNRNVDSTNNWASWTEEAYPIFKKYAVTDSNGGTANPANIISGKTYAPLYIKVTKDGYDATDAIADVGGTFNAATDTFAVNAGVVVRSDVTLSVTWAGVCDITLDYNYGSLSGSAKATPGESNLNNYTKPTREGYALEGWYSEAIYTNKVADDTGNFTLNDIDGYISGGKWTGTSGKTLYAKWTENYSIVYSLNNGTAGTNNPKNCTAGTLYNISPPTKAGYVFKGWLLSGSNANYENAKYADSALGTQYAISSSTEIINSTATNDVYVINLSSTSNGEVNLTAKWEEYTYSIKFETGGGTTTPQIDGVKFNAVNAITAPSRTGYTFAGWTITGSDNINSDATKAVFGNTPSTGTPVTTVTGMIKNTDNTATGSVYVKYLAKTAKEVTLTATWTANSYTLTLDKNGGTGGSSSATVTYNSSAVSFSGGFFSAPTRDGYTFAGYTVTQNGIDAVINAAGNTLTDFTSYVSSGKWIRDGSPTLFAKWTAIVCTVKLNANGGFSDANVSVTSGNTTVSFTPPTKQGYTFAGYTASQNGSDTVISASNALFEKSVTGLTDASGKWNCNSDSATIYAKWTPLADRTCTVEYWFDGYRLLPDKIVSNLVFDSTFTEQPEKITGYSSNRDSISITVGLTGNLISFIYSAESYTVWLVNGPGDESSFRAVYGSSDPDAYTAPFRSGAEFGGYWTSEKGGILLVTSEGRYAGDYSGYIENGVWVGLSGLTLYACWTGTAGTVVMLDLNGASSGSSSFKIEIGASSVPRTHVMPAKGNLEFLGYRDASGQTVVNADGSLRSGIDGITDANGKWTLTGGTLDLTAEWGRACTRVELNLNGTTYGSRSLIMEAGDTSLPGGYVKSVRYTYTFMGYFTGTDAGSHMVIGTDGKLVAGVPGITGASGEWISSDAALRLFAHWTASQGTDIGPAPEGVIRYHSNGGAFDGKVQEIDGKSYIKFDRLPTREGWRFVGWAESPDATAARYVPGITKVPAYFTTDLYAVWEIIIGPTPDVTDTSSTTIALMLSALMTVLLLSAVSHRKRRNLAD